MTSVNISEYDKNITNEAWEFKEVLSAPGTGSSVLIPVNVDNIGIQLTILPNAAAKVQVTNDTVAAVLNDTATWIDWELGEIGLTGIDTIYAVTAIRHVCTLIESTMTVRAQ